MTSSENFALGIPSKVTPPPTSIAVTLLLLCLFAIAPAFAQQPLQRLTDHVPTIVANGQAPLLGSLLSHSDYERTPASTGRVFRV